MYTVDNGPPRRPCSAHSHAHMLLGVEFPDADRCPLGLYQLPQPSLHCHLAFWKALAVVTLLCVALTRVRVGTRLWFRWSP
jgi:hypothetical protein